MTAVTGFHASSFWLHPLIGFGTHCTWWGPLDKAAKLSHLRGGGAWVEFPDGFPLCPHCRRTLWTCNEEAWVLAIRDAWPPDEAAIYLWGREQCYPDDAALRAAYKQEANAP